MCEGENEEVLTVHHKGIWEYNSNPGSDWLRESLRRDTVTLIQTFRPFIEPDELLEGSNFQNGAKHQRSF